MIERKHIHLAQLRELLPAFARLVRWQPAAVAHVLVALLIWWQHDNLDTVSALAWHLRSAALILTVGAVFMLDDASADLTAAVPLSLAWRNGLRITLAVAAVVPAWLSTLAVGRAQVTEALPPVNLEMITILAWGLLVGSLAARRLGVREPGRFAAPAVVAGAFVLFAVAQQTVLLSNSPVDWPVTRLRWAGLAMIVIGALSWTLRDPAGGRRQPHDPAVGHAVR